MKINRKTLEASGLDVRVGTDNVGRKCFLVKDPKSLEPYTRDIWWVVTRGMRSAMRKVGVLDGFHVHATLCLSVK